MAKGSKSHNMKTFGGRLRYYRERAGLTQQQLADKIHVSRQTLQHWEKERQTSYKPYLSDITRELDVDEETLLTGIPLENQTVASDLGLTNDSIEFLRTLTKATKNEMISIGPLDDLNRDETSYITAFLQKPSYERASDMIFSINWLLSHPEGKRLLALIYQYSTIETEIAKAAVAPAGNAEHTELQAEEFIFTTVDQQEIRLQPDAIIPALKEEITDTITIIRKKIRHEINRKMPSKATIKKEAADNGEESR